MTQDVLKPKLVNANKLKQTELCRFDFVHSLKSFKSVALIVPLQSTNY